MVTWSEHSIARAISLQTLARKCVLLVDNCNWTGHECDILGVTTDLRIIDVEVKISRSDLKADAKKDKWWITQFQGYGEEYVVTEKHYGKTYDYKRRDTIYSRVARPWPPKVWKHYYALPAEIWKPDLIDALPSENSGILLLDRDGYPRYAGHEMRVDCIRRAKPNRDAARLKPEHVMDIARLANLRMWESYHRCDQAQAESRRWHDQVRAMTGGLTG